MTRARCRTRAWPGDGAPVGERSLNDMSDVFFVTFSLVYLFWRLFQALPARTARPNSRLRDLVVSWFHSPRQRPRVMLLAAGLAAGGGAAWIWRGNGLDLGGLLLGLLAVGLALEECVDAPDQRRLPAVLGMLAVVQEEIRAGKNVFAALAATLPHIRNTTVQGAVRETLRRFSARQRPEACLAALLGVNHYLDEFVADVTRAGWENSLDLSVILQLLFARAGQAWTRTRRQRIWVDRVRPGVRFAQTFVAGGVATGVGLLAGEAVIPFFWIICAGVGALVLRQIFSSFRFRRAALLTLLAFGLSSPLFSPVSTQAHSEQRRVKSLNDRPPLSRVQLAEPMPLPVEETAEDIVGTLQPDPVEETVDAQEGDVPFEEWQCMVTTGSDQGKVNLRQGPEMGFPVLSLVAEGEWVLLHEETGDYWTSGIWRKVVANESQGWIYAPLCQTASELEGENVGR